MSQPHSTSFTQYSDKPHATIGLALDPDENKLQIREQTLVQDLDHQGKFRLYLQGFMKLGNFEFHWRTGRRYSSTDHFANVF